MVFESRSLQGIFHTSLRAQWCRHRFVLQCCAQQPRNHGRSAGWRRCSAARLDL